MNYRELLKDKKRVVIKVGSSSLIHKETNKLDLRKLEVLVRELSDLHNQGKDVVLVTSGAVAVGASAFGMHEKPTELKKKQACSAVGQARLMMIYQKLFSEYNQMAAQILMTKNTMVNNLNRRNARNTFEELLELGAIPVVNENDSISSYELEMLESFGDNDTLSAVIAGLIGADLLILLSDIDGLFTDDPNTNPDAEFIDTVEVLDEKLAEYGKRTEEQGRNRWNGYKTDCCRDSNGCRCGYGDREWPGFSCDPQDHGRQKIWYLICRKQKRRVFPD